MPGFPAADDNDTDELRLVHDRYHALCADWSLDSRQSRALLGLPPQPEGVRAPAIPPVLSIDAETRMRLLLSLATTVQFAGAWPEIRDWLHGPCGSAPGATVLDHLSSSPTTIREYRMVFTRLLGGTAQKGGFLSVADEGAHIGGDWLRERLARIDVARIIYGGEAGEQDGRKHVVTDPDYVGEVSSSLLIFEDPEGSATRAPDALWYWVYVDYLLMRCEPKGWEPLDEGDRRFVANLASFGHALTVDGLPYEAVLIMCLNEFGHDGLPTFQPATLISIASLLIGKAGSGTALLKLLQAHAKEALQHARRFDVERRTRSGSRSGTGGCPDDDSSALSSAPSTRR